MLSYDCKRKWQVGSCSCIDNGLNCSEACTYQGCENMAKEDDDDHFDHNVFLSLQNVYFPELYFEYEIFLKI